MTGTNLTGANLTSASLNGSELPDANIASANFTAAVLLGVSSGGIIGTPTSFPTNWALVDGYIIGPYANLSGGE